MGQVPNLTLKEFADLFLYPPEDSEQICKELLTDPRAIVSLVDEEHKNEINHDYGGRNDQLPDENYDGIGLSKNFRYGIHGLLNYADSQGEPKKWMLCLTAIKNWHQRYEQWDNEDAHIRKKLNKDHGIPEAPQVSEETINQFLEGVHPEDRSDRIKEIFNTLAPVPEEDTILRAAVYFSNMDKHMPVDQILAAEEYLRYVIFKKYPEAFSSINIYEEPLMVNEYLANIKEFQNDGLNEEEAKKAALDMAIYRSDGFLSVIENKSNGLPPDYDPEANNDELNL